jgi:4-amino-4-deoxy-L-arabinose transferase-like glycosyltransferase
LLPLFFAGNKQNHYLVPMLPPMAMLGAYAVCRGLSPGCKDGPLVRWVIGITFALVLVSPLAVYVIGRHLHRPIGPAELALLVVMFAALIATISMTYRHGLLSGVACFSIGMALVYPVLFGRWLPSLNLMHHRAIALELREAFDDGPYVFYGKDFSLPLIWNMRQTIPLVENAQELQRVLDDAPGTIVITEAKNKHQPPAIPDRLEKRAEYQTGDEGAIFRIYTSKR